MRERLGLEADLTGVVVSEVKVSSPADKAGIRVGDIIVRIGKDAVRGMDDFKRLMKEHALPNESVLIRVFRGEEIPTVTVLKVPGDYVPEP